MRLELEQLARDEAAAQEMFLERYVSLAHSFVPVIHANSGALLYLYRMGGGLARRR